MKMRPIHLAILAVAELLAGTAVPQPRAAPLWGQLAAGPHETGFHRIWTKDATRIWPRSAALDSLEGSVARPIRVDVWFPATCASPQRMTLSGYVFPEPPSPDYEDLVFLTSRWDEYSYLGLAERDSTAFDLLMRTKTAVCSSAVVAPGRFPLVLYSAGWFNRAPDNTILAEFLASHGFVVASVPQLNPGLWTYNFQSDARSVENQVRDLEVALGVLIKEPYVDRRHIAAMGYSTGGDVALLLQGRSALVDGVVGLDASFTLGPDNDVEGSPYFTPAHHNEPILAVRRSPEEGVGYNAVLGALSAASRVVAEIPGADHGSFSDDPAERRLLGADTTGHQDIHALVAETVLAFLQETLLNRDEFDAISLAEQYRSHGLVAKALSPTDQKEDDDEGRR